MSGALERAARALCDNESALMGWNPDRAWVAQQSKYIDFARAVLMAVRDIDPAIHDKVTIGGWLDDEMKFAEAWHGGIDAILGEGEGE